MKPNRDAAALAASLSIAANTPLQLPQQQTVRATSPVQPVEQVRRREPARRAKSTNPGVTAQITLRPERTLLDHYTFQAAERTKIERRVVSAQEIMLEVLERGRSKGTL